jgi:hypothetical protein
MLVLVLRINSVAHVWITRHSERRILPAAEYAFTAE